jgi:hypothetical protein
MNFGGYFGGTFGAGPGVGGRVDGTPTASNSIPTELVFRTKEQGTTATFTAMRWHRCTKTCFTDCRYASL